MTEKKLKEMANDNGFYLSERQIEKVLTKIDRSEYYEVKILKDPREMAREMTLEDTVESSFAGRTSNNYGKQETAQLLFAGGGYVKFGKLFKREHYEYSERTQEDLRLTYPKFSLKCVFAFAKHVEEWEEDEEREKNMIIIYVPPFQI